MILEHLKESWTSHLGAFSATSTSLVSGSGLLQSVLVGVLVFIITKVISIGMRQIWSKWS